MSMWMVVIPVISAFIGWVTNWVAIKMLFHPREPIHLLGITVQGIFPKRQRQFAERLGKMVSEELLSFSDIQTRVTNPENLRRLMPIVEEHVDEFLRRRLTELFPVISMFIGEKTIGELKTHFMNELERIFPILMQRYMNHLQSELDLEKIVVDKVTALTSDRLEALLMSVMAREFRFVEILGGILGFLIGLLQVAITLLAA
ncbi:MAG: DUF445 family protein [Bacteroidetes bacterium]|nr:DUF445 family protein [Bacteroidota bacterium]